MRSRNNGNSAMGVFHGRRIAVSGGPGSLGRVVVRKLHERGCTDLTVPRRATCDLSRWDHIEQFFDKCRLHLLLHLAATVDNPASHRDVAESFYNNAMMAMQVIEASSRHGVEKMICIGSASSYPANALVPLREQDLFKGLPDPARAVRGIAKRLPLIQAQAYRQQHGFHCVFLIPTNFYGPGDNFEPKTSYVIASLIRKFVNAVDTGATEIVIGGIGCATRDFIHVEDCAEGILLALEHYRSGDAVNQRRRSPHPRTGAQDRACNGLYRAHSVGPQLSGGHHPARVGCNSRAKGIWFSRPTRPERRTGGNRGVVPLDTRAKNRAAGKNGTGANSLSGLGEYP
jgi:GDP-L-fucose synthase